MKTLDEQILKNLEKNISYREKIPEKEYFKIGEVAETLSVKPYVLRYWESEFSFLQVEKSEKGQRLYHRNDLILLCMLKHLLYVEHYSIVGAKRRLEELGLKNISDSEEGRISAGVKEKIQKLQDRAQILSDKISIQLFS